MAGREGGFSAGARPAGRGGMGWAVAAAAALHGAVLAVFLVGGAGAVLRPAALASVTLVRGAAPGGVPSGGAAAVPAGGGTPVPSPTDLPAPLPVPSPVPAAEAVRTPPPKPARRPAPRPAPRPALRAAPRRPTPGPVARPPQPPAQAAVPAAPVAAGPGSAEPAAGARPAGEAAGAGPAPEVSKNWEAALSAWLAAHRRYPAAARRDGVEGRVVLRITVARDGRVTGLVLAGPSGSEILDQAAMAVLRGAVVPPFPAGMPQDSVIVTVPLRYALAH